MNCWRGRSVWRTTYADGSVATFTYDAAGRLVQADDTADPHRPIALAYDTLDRLVSEATALGAVAYQYDALGLRTQMRVNALNPVTYTYDSASRLRNITQAPHNPVTIDYDAVGRRTKLTLTNAVSTEYQYNAASRLTALIYGNATGLLGNLTYTYDPAGNRTGVGGSFARTLLPDPVAAATYDAANRQFTFDDKQMTYDANGSLTSLTDASGTTTFTWDTRNRLVTLAGSEATATFAYDAKGRRARREVGGEQREYQYDGVDVIRERVAEVDATYLRSLGIDQTFCRIEASGAAYYLADALSTTVALTEGSGAIRTTYTYDPFGRTAVTGPSNANAIQYTGRENDKTGFYSYRARYYSPTLQRFLGEDPIKIVGGGPNFYVYVKNSPLNFTDPTGLLLLDCTRPLQGRLGNYGALHRFVWRDGRTYGFCSQGQDTSLSSFFRTKPGAACPAEAPDILRQASTSCQAVITDPLTEQCVEKVGQDLMTDANPPDYSLKSHNCQDWATKAFGRCGLNRYYQEFPRIRALPPLVEAPATP